MRVKALHKGHYGTLRQPGEVFDINDKKAEKGDKWPIAFSPRWMRAVNQDKAVSRPELGDDGKLLVAPRPQTPPPVKNIKDLDIDGQSTPDVTVSPDEEYEPDPADAYDTADEPDEVEAEPKAKTTRRPRRAKAA